MLNLPAEDFGFRGRVACPTTTDADGNPSSYEVCDVPRCASLPYCADLSLNMHPRPQVVDGYNTVEVENQEQL
eukprot:4839537-Pyramimonas_sp.AAC.1